MFTAQNGTNASSKRQRSRTPSPERRLRQKREDKAADVPSGPQKGIHLSEDEFLERLKPLKGLAPSNIWCLVADRATGNIYSLESWKDRNMSRLWCLHASTMDWELLTIRSAEIFGDAEDSLPYRAGERLVLFGPKDHRRLLAFGGEDVDGNVTSDMFCIDLKIKMWSRVSIEGGSITPRSWASVILVDEYKLFIFGGRSQDGWIKSFSLAVFEPSKRFWTWKIRDRQLPQQLLGFTCIDVTPLYGGKKLLVTALSSNEKMQKRVDVQPNHTFIFDPTLQRFDLDPYVAGETPQSIIRCRFSSGSVENEAIMRCQKVPNRHEFWSYHAYPDSKWKCLLKVDIFPAFTHWGPIACMGKNYVLVSDNREGQKGVNKYFELTGESLICNHCHGKGLAMTKLATQGQNAEFIG